MKKQKEENTEKYIEEKKKEILTSPGIGETVPLVTSVSAGCEISDIYLKHPANESSDDSEGEEESKNDITDGILFIYY